MAVGVFVRKSIASSVCFVLLMLGALLPVVAQNSQLDPLAKADTRLMPGFQLSITVAVNGIDEKELCGTFTLDPGGNLKLTVGGEPMDQLPLSGVTCETACARIRDHIRRFFASPPEVLMRIAHIPRIKVTVQGATFVNGSIELPQGAKLSDAMAATSYQTGADLSQVIIKRTQTGGKVQTLIADFGKTLEGTEDQFSNPKLEHGDIISLSLKPVVEIQPTIAIIGEARKVGAVFYKKGMTVRDALAEAGPLDSADLPKMSIRRLKSNTVLKVDGVQAMANVATENVKLEPDDTLFIPPKDTGNRVGIIGEVANPITEEFKRGLTLKEAIVKAGGFRNDADRKHIIISKNMLRDPSGSTQVEIDYDKIAAGINPDFPLQAGDLVQVPAKKRSQNNFLGTLGSLLLRFILPF